MKAISLKMEEEIVNEIDSRLKSDRYSTRTEFIRDAIREKLSELEKNELLKKLNEVTGFSDKKTTDKDLHDIRKKLASEMGLK